MGSCGMPGQKISKRSDFENTPPRWGFTPSLEIRLNRRTWLWRGGPCMGEPSPGAGRSRAVLMSRSKRLNPDKQIAIGPSHHARTYRKPQEGQRDVHSLTPAALLVLRAATAEAGLISLGLFVRVGTCHCVSGVIAHEFFDSFQGFGCLGNSFVHPQRIQPPGLLVVLRNAVSFFVTFLKGWVFW